MSWPDFMAARQHLAEERLGRLVRQDEAAEDDAFAASRSALARQGG